MAKDGLERRFRRVLESRGWLARIPILLGVSGGSDSVSLLCLFYHTLGAENIAVVHMDHGLREAAVRDSEFVSGLCERLRVRCVVERRSVRLLARKGESDEAAGRRLRYELYEEVRSRLACPLVALGHTRNDLAESTLMNIARGCGLWGLAGMPEQRGSYIRPLLGFWREELREYLRACECPWIEDETNELDIYQRNRVRHHVLPMLELNVNSRAAEHLASLAEETLAWRRMQDELSQKNFVLCGGTRSEWSALDLKKTRKLDDLQRIELIRWLGRRLDLPALPRGRTEELNKLIRTSGRWLFQWGSEVDVAARDGYAVFHPAAEKYSLSAELDENHSVRWGGWKVSLCRGASCPENTGYGFCCAVDPDRPVTLEKDGQNDVFPRVFQENVFSAERKQNMWEISSDSVKYTDVAQILFTPLAGCWRNDLWH